MAAKTTICVICGRRVSKRSTLDLKVLDPKRRGRACRAHPEVAELHERLRRNRERILAERMVRHRRLERMKDRINSHAGAEFVRAVLAVRPEHDEVAYAALSRIGYSQADIERVRACVTSCQGTPLNATERSYVQDIRESMERSTS